MNLWGDCSLAVGEGDFEVLNFKSRRSARSKDRGIFDLSILVWPVLIVEFFLVLIGFTVFQDLKLVL